MLLAEKRAVSEYRQGAQVGMLHSDLPFPAPNTGGRVGAFQVCHAFTPRDDVPRGVTRCRYCRHGQFDEATAMTTATGVCQWH